MMAILGTFLVFAIIGIGGLALFAIGLKYCIIAVREFVKWLLDGIK